MIVLVGALSQWLMKRRQANQADNRPDGDEPLPSPGNRKSARRANSICRRPCANCWAANRLPARHSRRPFRPSCVTHNLRRVGRTKNNSSPNRRGWMNRRRLMKRPVHRQSKPPRLHGHTPPWRERAPLALRPANRHEEAVRRFEQLNEQGRHPATVVNTGRGRRSREGTRAIGVAARSSDGAAGVRRLAGLRSAQSL